jgi:hypothetical protein
VARIFVSSQAVDGPPAVHLIEALRAGGLEVVHSPRNPADGSDGAWPTWYARGLREAVAGADVAVLVVDQVWESSTWMGEESQVALAELGPDRVAFWNPARVAVTSPAMRAYLKARLPDTLTDSVALLSKRASSGFHLDVASAIRSEWRDLGFFYDIDDQLKSWRLRGTLAGLGRFVTALDAYVASPDSLVEGEHEHFGPYMYLKVMTAMEAVVNNDAIAGTVDDLARLARLIEQSLRHATPGDRFMVGREFSPTAEYSIDFFIESDDFDPGDADASIVATAG